MVIILFYSIDLFIKFKKKNKLLIKDEIESENLENSELSIYWNSSPRKSQSVKNDSIQKHENQENQKQSSTSPKKLAVQIDINVPPKYKVDIFFLDTMNTFHGFKYKSNRPVKQMNILKKKGLFISEFVTLGLDLIEHVICAGKKIPYTNSTSKFLIFLPGLAEIFYFLEQLETRLKQINYPPGLFEIITLHSDLTQDFDLRTISNKKRYFILATNIAESSITIPDIVFVIDFCLTKELFVRKNQISCLELMWSSRASCLQRKGRTGRLNHGYCFYMLPKNFFNNFLTEHATPEMIRIPLDKIILKCNLIKSLLRRFRDSIESKNPNSIPPTNVINENTRVASDATKEKDQNVRILRIDRLLQVLKNPHFILRLALDVPEENKIEMSLNFLKNISAIKYNASSREFYNTFLGKLYCELPLPVTSIKLIIYGKIFDCLEDTINIACLLNHSKGILKLSKNMTQEQINRMFNLYQRMDQRQYSDIIILNNLFKGFF